MIATETRIEDNQLVIMANSGNQNATEELMQRYRETINKISRRFFLVGGEIEDIAQEGLIGLYKAIKNYDPNREASFKTFANICIKHQIHNIIKKSNSLKDKVFRDRVAIDPSLAEHDEGFYVALPVDETSPETELLERESHEEFEAKTNKLLSNFEKQVLSFYLQGFSYNEIALQLLISKKNVDNALTRIKAKLTKF